MTIKMFELAFALGCLSSIVSLVIIVAARKYASNKVAAILGIVTFGGMIVLSVAIALIWRWLS